MAQTAVARLAEHLCARPPAGAPPTEPAKAATMKSSAWRRSRTRPGWNLHRAATGLTNPRPPAVPATLDLTLEEYYAAAATIGLLAAQEVEPDPEWAAKWSLEYGQTMARESRRRRRQRTKS